MARIVKSSMTPETAPSCFFCVAPVDLAADSVLLVEWEEPSTSVPVCAECVSAWDKEIGEVFRLLIAAIRQEAMDLTPWSERVLLAEADRLERELSAGVVVTGDAQLWADEWAGVSGTQDGGKPCIALS